MKKILFPFELNQPDYREAYLYAVKTARNLRSELIMLNVFNVETSDEITTESYHQQVRTNWLKAYNEVTRLNQYYIEKHARPDTELSIKYDHRFIHGKFTEEIHKILETETIDLVVIPISDDNNLNKKQLKLVRDNIFERNDASLLVVPNRNPFRPLQKIIFATNLQKLQHHELYLNDILRYADAFNAAIHFLHINTTGQAVLPKDAEAYRTMMWIIENNQQHTFKSINSTNIAESIMQYAREVHADMLVAVKHQHFFMDSLFHTSISEQLSVVSDIPVLIMREKNG